MAVAPEHIAGDRLALFLGAGRINCGHQFTAHIGSVDALPFKVNIYTQAFQLTDGFQAVFCISGKSGNGFDHDTVYQAAAAVIHHTSELIALFCRSSGNTFIGINIYHLPI